MSSSERPPARNPYRDELLPLFRRTKLLERENAHLRRLVFALLFALLVVAGLAGWWFSVAWTTRR
jgi:hypothetical protein